MKTFKISILSFVFAFFAFSVSAQTKSETIKVAGECGMCKNKIEKAAKGAGASYANWDVDNKVLTVKYNSTSSNSAKIQKAVAAVGYDTETNKATEEAYNKLHSCCKYERTASNDAKAACCDNGKCADCCKDGKCKEGMDCCKNGKCAKADACCKDAKCEHKDDAAYSAKGKEASCCKKS
jgi:periplasmic mercuric ion binding protein